MSDQTSTCPHCGKPASQQLLGMCPECMLKAGLAGATRVTGEGTIPEPPGRFVPPTVHELGHYFPQLEILELIGRGGMGAVYKARQKQLDRIVALKILPPGIGDDPAFADRFTREARALAALAHPNIVTLYEFGQTDGLFFFLMEFVDGVNLRQLLSGGKLAPKEALAIVPHICDALQYAHDRGIVHRDIKPENILLGRDGVVKIADFGVAKIIGRRTEKQKAESRNEAAGATGAGGAVGTPAYMAPEQVDRPAEVDHRADIYSLGVVLYQMLTGELPGKQIEPPSRKVQIDVRIDEIVMRALEHNPELRYSQASVFKTEVQTIAAEVTAGSTRKPGTDAMSGAPDMRNWGESAQRFHLRKVEYLIPIIAMAMIGITSIATMIIAHTAPGNWIASVLSLLKIASNVEAAVVWGGLAWCILRWARYSRHRPPNPSASELSYPQAAIPPVPLPAGSNPASRFSRTSNHRVAWVLAAVVFVAHTALFLALVVFAAFIVPRFAVIFMDFKTELPLLTRMTLALSHGIMRFWYLAIPLFIATDAAICLLLGYLNARRLLIAWLICGMALLLAVTGAMFLSLFLPIQQLTQTIR